MNYSTVLIEVFTAILGLVLLVAGLIIPRTKRNVVGYISIAGLACILVFSFVYSWGNNSSFYHGLYLSDNIAVYFKQLFVLSAMLVTIMSLSHAERFDENKNEYFALLVFALVGMMIMSSANDLITLYMGLELMSITFVILTAFDKANVKSTEAGTKYVLLSAMSSAVLLYGMSLLYGLSGSTAFPQIVKYMKSGYSQPMAIVACTLLIAGFSFKISAVPFHMWAPDIYEGAPTAVTAFLAGGSKAAAFAVLIRLTMQLMNTKGYDLIVILIIALSALSMIIGNIIAIPQTSIKRMLAYSGISHAGYMMLGLVAHTKAGVGAMLYYLLLYAIANIGAFAAVIAFSNVTGSEEIKDFGGMWRRSPFLAATLMICLLSLAGIPPAAGFIGKFYLISSVIKTGSGYLWMAILTMCMSVVSIYYYISVIKVLILGENTESSPIKVPVSLKVVMVAAIVITLVMGLYPGPVTDWTTTVASAFIK